MPDPKYTPGTMNIDYLNAVYNAIYDGDPKTMYDDDNVDVAAGNVFITLYKNVDTLTDDMVDEKEKLVSTGEKIWEGPAATAFGNYISAVTSAIDGARAPLDTYSTALGDAAAALKEAREDIDAASSAANGYLDTKANQTADNYNYYNEWAKGIFDKLIQEYEEAEKQLVEIEAPNFDAGTGTDGDPKGGGDTDEKDKKGGGDTDEKDDKEKDDKEKDDDKKKDDSGGGGGGSPDGGGSTGNDKAKEGGGSGGGGPNDPSKEPGTPGSTPDGPGGVPDAKKEPISDDNRIFPHVPTVTKGGVEGIDLDKKGAPGYGIPDIGRDGKPLPDSKRHEVTYKGVRGIDVNGDKKPDIGKDGEILKYAPIVQGPDGTIGIDIDKDGKPDIAIHGQYLPDACIVEYDGIRGLDINGDDKPDIGMDRKPTDWAPLERYQGVRGVDVDGDHKPDIDMDGNFTDWAPRATRPDGIVGIDVDNDKKPDIALTDVQRVTPRRGADAIPDLYQKDRLAPYAPDLANRPAPEVPPVGARLRNGDPYGTTLTGSVAMAPYAPVDDPLPTGPGTSGAVGGPAGGPINPYAAAFPAKTVGPTSPGVELASAGPDVPPGVGTTLMGAASASGGSVPPGSGAAMGPYMGGMAGMAGAAGKSSGAEGATSALGKPKLTEDTDVWDDAAGGTGSALGRPPGR